MDLSKCTLDVTLTVTIKKQHINTPENNDTHFELALIFILLVINIHKMKLKLRTVMNATRGV